MFFPHGFKESDLETRSVQKLIEPITSVLEAVLNFYESSSAE